MAKKSDNPVDYSKPLANPRYEQFCQAYILTNNATRAAKSAKYSEKTANVKGSQLLAIVSIQNRLAVLQGNLSKETGISVKYVADGFKKICDGQLSKELTNKNKLRAFENLGKHVGFYERDNKQKVDALASLLGALDGKTKGIPGQ